MFSNHNIQESKHNTSLKKAIALESQNMHGIHIYFLLSFKNKPQKTLSTIVNTETFYANKKKNILS